MQEVIRTICSPYGFVQRIVIFRKNGLQVLVEYPLLICSCGCLLCVGVYCPLTNCFRFDSNASAQRTKQQLDGADIYAGCCTLKIEYAKVSLCVCVCVCRMCYVTILQTNRLNVYKNDEMTWDFTAQGRCVFVQCCLQLMWEDRQYTLVLCVIPQHTTQSSNGFSFFPKITHAPCLLCTAARTHACTRHTWQTHRSSLYCLLAC